MSRAKRLLGFLLPFLTSVAVIALIPSAGRADIVFSGNVTPSSSAEWNSGMNGYVGEIAAGTVTVDSDSDLVVSNGYLGYGFGVTGTVKVEGAGSTWTTAGYYDEEDEEYLGGNLYVGNAGNGILDIQSGGGVISNSGYLGYESGSAGTATIDGDGSTWAVNGVLHVGYSGNGTLKIIDGGAVSNADATIASNNITSISAVTVQGTGSTWINDGDLSVGQSGMGTLNITGGLVSTTGTTYIGSSASIAAVNFNGGTLTTKALHIHAATEITGNGTISGLKGLVSDVSLTFDGVGSANVTFNDQVTGIMDMSAASGNGDLGVGYSGSGSLTITSGANVYSANGYLGYDENSSGAATVDGASTWTNSEDLYVGHTGSGSLNITGGGTVTNNACCLGYYPPNLGVSSGTVTVEGAGSTWINNDKLQIGGAGSGTLNVNSGGAVLVGATTYVGDDSTGTGTINFGGGTLTTNGLWVAGADLTGTGTIDTKGLVSDVNLTFDAVAIASATFGSAGVMTVNVSATSGNGDLGAGHSDNGSLTIKNGAQVYSSNGYLGYKAGSSGTATVDGDATWTTGGSSHLDGAIHVGYRGDGMLSITNGGTVTTQGGFPVGGHIGTNLGSSGTATVDGAGSTWTITGSSGDLHVGRSGAGILKINNGGAVANGSGAIGYYDSGSGTVTVESTDAISTWINSEDLYVGDDGNGTLNINSGGSVSVGDSTYVGKSNGSGTINFGGGTLTTGGLWAMGTALTGTGVINTKGLVSDASLMFDETAIASATFGTAGTMTVDMRAASGNGVLGAGYADNGSLTIRNGTQVYSAKGCLGYKAGSSGTATVDAATWTNSDDDRDGCLIVGYEGDGVLNITGGGTVVSQTAMGAVAYIGSQPGSSGTVTVDGAGSLWDIIGNFRSGTLHVGGRGTGTLNVTDGGTVAVGQIRMGRSGTGTVNFDGGTLLARDTARSFLAVTNAYVKQGGVTIDTNGYNVTIDQVLQTDGAGNGGLTKTGNGTLTLRKANTYTGLTTVSAGTLKYDANNVIASGDVLVNGGVLDLSYRSDTVGAVTLADGGIMGTGMLTSTGGFVVQSGSASAILDGAVALTKTTSGTVTLTGANAYTGLTTVSGGVLHLGVDAQNPVFNEAGANITSGKLVFAHSGGTNTGAAIQTILDGAYDDDFASGQIHSSTALGEGRALGWSDNGSEVTIMYTLYGDSNLDGSVNGSDLNAVLSSYNLSGQVWAHGDFNYDGSVNGSDLNTVLSNYNQSLPASTAAVPEPSTLLLMVLGLVGLLAYVMKKRK